MNMSDSRSSIDEVAKWHWNHDERLRNLRTGELVELTRLGFAFCAAGFSDIIAGANSMSLNEELRYATATNRPPGLLVASTGEKIVLVGYALPSSISDAVVLYHAGRDGSEGIRIAHTVEDDWYGQYLLELINTVPPALSVTPTRISIAAIRTHDIPAEEKKLYLPASPEVKHARMLQYYNSIRSY